MLLIQGIFGRFESIQKMKTPTTNRGEFGEKRMSETTPANLHKQAA